MTELNTNRLYLFGFSFCHMFKYYNLDIHLQTMVIYEVFSFQAKIDQQFGFKIHLYNLIAAMPTYLLKNNILFIIYDVMLRHLSALNSQMFSHDQNT